MSKQIRDNKKKNKLRRIIKPESRMEVLKQGTMSIRVNCLSKDGCGY